MRQAPRSPLSFKLQRVANVPEHPPPSTRLMSCAHIANRQLSRIIGARWRVAQLKKGGDGAPKGKGVYRCEASSSGSSTHLIICEPIGLLAQRLKSSEGRGLPVFS